MLYFGGTYLLSFVPNPVVGTVLSILYGLVLLGVLLIRVRTVLHKGLLEAALEFQARNAGVGPDGVLSFCSRCEMPLLPGAAFCGNCGTSVLASSHLHSSDSELVSVGASTSEESVVEASSTEPGAEASSTEPGAEPSPTEPSVTVSEASATDATEPSSTEPVVAEVSVADEPAPEEPAPEEPAPEPETQVPPAPRPPRRRRRSAASRPVEPDGPAPSVDAKDQEGQA